MRFSENGLFNALEKVLRETGQPMDCVQLYDYPDVQAHAASPNRVSDYLGNLWRKGLVVRLPTTGDGKSRARWMYQWKDRAPAGVEGVPYTAKLLVDRPTMLITEEGKTVQIELGNFTILIKQKD